jgi:addiction module HigA family antidote
MKNPPYPGRSIRTACLEPLGLSVTEGAKVLGVSRQTLNNVINGKTGISPQMAIRLSKGRLLVARPKRGCECRLLTTLLPR